jgi:hypothetical protein
MGEEVAREIESLGIWDGAKLFRKDIFQAIDGKQFWGARLAYLCATSTYYCLAPKSLVNLIVTPN